MSSAESVTTTQVTHLMFFAMIASVQKSLKVYTAILLLIFFSLLLPSLKATCCILCEKEGLHNGHTLVPLEGSLNYLVDILESCSSVLASGSSSVGAVQQSLEERTIKTRTSIEKAKEDVRLGFDRIRKAVSTKEAWIIESIDRYALGEDVSCFTSEVKSMLGELPLVDELAKSTLKELEAQGASPGAVKKVKCIKEKSDKVCQLKSKYNEAYNDDICVDTKGLKSSVNKVVEVINGLQCVNLKKISLSPPASFRVQEIGPFSVSLCWDKREEDDEYTISIFDKNSAESVVQTHVSTTNEATIGGLRQDNSYEFYVRANRNGVFSGWSNALSVTTDAFTAEPSIAVLRENPDKGSMCAEAMNKLVCFTAYSNYMILMFTFFFHVFITFFS